MCERNIDPLPLTCPQLGTWPATQACAPTRNRSSNLLVCRPALTLLEHLGKLLIHHCPLPSLLFPPEQNIFLKPLSFEELPSPFLWENPVNATVDLCLNLGNITSLLLGTARVSKRRKAYDFSPLMLFLAFAHVPMPTPSVCLSYNIHTIKFTP